MSRSGYVDDYIDEWELIRWRGALDQRKMKNEAENRSYRAMR
jgi:hypothetical protein